MTDQRRLPAEFQQSLIELERAYLQHDDPIRQSGFSGGAQRWRAEREPLLDAVQRSGALLDLGCANGHLLECLVAWGRERGLAIEPHGLDQGAQLIALARQRMAQFADHFYLGNSWDWQPPRRFDYVYALYDCVPSDYLADYVARILREMVAPGGRLIVGAYGSRSRGLAPFPIAEFLSGQGYALAGTSRGGNPALTSFAWLDA